MLKNCNFCQKLPTDDQKFARCSRCFNVCYCGPSCQRADWKVHKRLCQNGVGIVQDSIHRTNKEDRVLAQIRQSYSLSAKKAEWWWCMDDSLLRIQHLLHVHNYVIVDQFLPTEDGHVIRQEVEDLYKNDHLSNRGIVGGGRFGKDEAEVDLNIRGDMLGYFDGNEDCFSNKKAVPHLIDKMNTCLCEMRDLNPVVNMVRNDLKDVRTRSKAMITCYPGNQAHYSTHVDNANHNGRKVTCIYYLNKDWKDGDGGCLNVYKNVSDTHHVASVAPLFNRLVMFWSDVRCPHEVSPCAQPRFALSVWFLDKKEKQAVL